MNYAIFSSDRNRTYAFFLPITSLLWRTRGWRPLVLLVGTAAEWNADPQLRLALERTRETGSEIHFVPEIKDVRTSTIAQVARIFGAAIPGVAEDDYLLTSDVDMLPLGPWIEGSREPDKDLHLWYANAYDQSERPHYPMCYIGASAKTWRRIIGGRTLHEAISEAPADKNSAWDYDELILSKWIARWRNLHPNKTQEIPRTFVEGEWRIDRSDWDGAMGEVERRGSLAGVADAHVVRPGDTAENWPRIRRVLEMALAPERLEWVDGYHEGWTTT